MDRKKRLETYYDFTQETYKREWDKSYMREDGVKYSASSDKAARLNAQRHAIDKTFVDSLLEFYPEISEKEIWDTIALVHKLNVANLGELGVPSDVHEEVFNRCISAHQSWIKSSGHSFERYVSGTDNEDLQKNEISFILQSDLTKMIKGKQLSNTKDDLEGLNSWGKDFDLYAVQSVHDDIHVFGCIQSKTSIRDRVGRDVTFSRNAMDGLFWSVAVTLDGAFLKMPEFIHMVNGGASYRENGWHGMYAMSGIDSDNGRIYKVNDTLDLFVKHAIQAAKQFISDRRLLNANWKAD